MLLNAGNQCAVNSGCIGKLCVPVSLIFLFEVLRQCRQDGKGITFSYKYSFIMLLTITNYSDIDRKNQAYCIYIAKSQKRVNYNNKLEICVWLYNK